MKINDNKKTILFYITYTLLLAFILLNIKNIGVFLGKIITILMPFIIGLLLAFILNVLLNVIENKIIPKIFKKKLKKKRVIALSLAILVIVLFLGLLMFLVVPELKNAILIFGNNLPEYIENMEIFLNNHGVSSTKIQEISSMFNDFKEMGFTFLKSNGKELLGSTITFATSLVSWVTNIVIGLVFAIYFLAEKEKLQGQFKRIEEAYLNKKQINKINQIFTLANKICSNFISGQCLEAIIIGLLCFMGMFILSLPYAPTISVLIGFTALIPVFGAFIGTIIGAFLIFMISPLKAIIFIIFILVLQQIEGNLIYPKVVGKSVGLPGIWVMVAVTIGASTFGIMGMLISVPLCSILYSILATNVHLRLQNK